MSAAFLEAMMDRQEAVRRICVEGRSIQIPSFDSTLLGDMVSPGW